MVSWNEQKLGEPEGLIGPAWMVLPRIKLGWSRIVQKREVRAEPHAKPVTPSARFPTWKLAIAAQLYAETEQRPRIFFRNRANFLNEPLLRFEPNFAAVLFTKWFTVTESQVLSWFRESGKVQNAIARRGCRLKKENGSFNVRQPRKRRANVSIVRRSSRRRCLSTMRNDRVTEDVGPVASAAFAVCN